MAYQDAMSVNTLTALVALSPVAPIAEKPHRWRIIAGKGTRIDAEGPQLLKKLDEAILKFKWDQKRKNERVCRLVPAVAEAYDIGGSIDLMLSAAILHDSFKYGHHKARYTTRDHPFLAADSMAHVYKEKGGESGIYANAAVR